MRNTGTAYLLLAVSLFGPHGLHRFYLGKPVSGLIYMMTLGLLGFGTLYDLITMQDLVDEANGRMLPEGEGHHTHPMLPASAAYGQPANPYMPARHAYTPQAQPASAPAPKASLETRLLQAARNHRGRMTVMQAAAELGVRSAEVEAKLDEMCHTGHANVEVSEDGVLYYDFPELRFS